jgi:hypothetical protein
MYFVTEPLPAGEPLKIWVESQSVKQTPPSVPGVGGETLTNLRQMSIEPAALRPVTAAPKIQSQSSGHVEISVPGGPGAPPGPRVRPIRSPEASPVEGSFSRVYTGERISGTAVTPDSPEPEPTRRPAPAAADAVGFSQIYGKDALSPALPLNDEVTLFPEPGTPPQARTQTGPGLETFLGLPRPQAASSASGAPAAAPLETPPERGRQWAPKQPAPIPEIPPVPLPDPLSANPLPKAYSPPPNPNQPADPAARRGGPSLAPSQVHSYLPAAPPETVAPKMTDSAQPGRRSIDWVMAVLVMLMVLALGGVTIWIAEHS